MGFFSWITSDTNRSICNIYSGRKTFPVYVLIPKAFGGGYVKEDAYEGYGKFGGQDIYSLVGRWNHPEKCNGDDSHDALIGVMTVHSFDKEAPKPKYPVKITEFPIEYELAEESKFCEYQGFFYDDDEEMWDENNEEC